MNDENTKLTSFKDALTNKKLRYGTFSTITSLIVIAVLVIVNVIAGQFDMSVDLTKEKMYTISDKSTNIIETLEEDITIYALFQTGAEIPMYTEILNQYASNSSRVQVVYKDPYIYPTFAKQYQKEDEVIETNSIIVESSGRYKVIAPDELVTYEIDYNTYSQYASTIDIESKVTNAIEYVLQKDTPVVYHIIGHGEEELSAHFKSKIDDQNFEYRTLDLFFEESIPEDCEALILTTPTKDYSSVETEKILDYLAADGRALVVVDSANVELTNVEKILNTYGTSMEYMRIVEGDSNYYMPNMPYIFMPQMFKHDITTALVEKNGFTFVATPQAVNVLDIKKSSITIEPLLATTALAYGKLSPESSSINKEDGDAQGPFSLAVAVTDSYYMGGDNFKTMLVVCSSAAFLNDSFDNQVMGGNSQFITTSLNWLIERSTSTTYIAPKSLTSVTGLTITSTQASTIKIISMVLIPCVILLAGLGIWILRKNK